MPRETLSDYELEKELSALAILNRLVPSIMSEAETDLNNHVDTFKALADKLEPFTDSLTSGVDYTQLIPKDSKNITAQPKYKPWSIKAEIEYNELDPISVTIQKTDMWNGQGVKLALNYVLDGNKRLNIAVLNGWSDTELQVLCDNSSNLYLRKPRKGCFTFLSEDKPWESFTPDLSNRFLV